MQSDLLAVTFEGGITKEGLGSILDGLSDDSAKKLRANLIQHVDMPAVHILPENSGGITEPPYTIEEAEQWVAEYQEAVSEVPKEDES